VNWSKEKMNKGDWIPFILALVIAQIIFQFGSFGFIPAFLIIMGLFWIFKKVVKMRSSVLSLKKEKEIFTSKSREKKVDDKKRKSIKTKVIWVIIIVFYVGLGLTFFFSQKDLEPITTDKRLEFSELSGNLYRNTKYNFRIKFPKGWEIKVGDGPHILQKATKNNSVISLAVEEIPAGLLEKTATIRDMMPIEEFKSEMINSLQIIYPEAELLDYGESYLDNKPAYWIKTSISSNILDIKIQQTSLLFQVLNKNILYTISAGSLPNEFASVEPEFIKSIATFVIEEYSNIYDLDIELDL